MKIGLVGLGKMGFNMAKRLLQNGHAVVGYAPSEKTRQAHQQNGGMEARSLSHLVEQLDRPRVVWVMVPAGDVTEQTIIELGKMLDPGDILIDGGNSNYKDSIRRAERLNQKGIHFLDVGTSGGIWGVSEGYSIMIGGDEHIVEKVRPIFEALAPGPGTGWGRVGPNGAGHFVKMIHNGIEYGMMQAYAEGFEILHAKKDFGLDLEQISEIWRFGSVVRSWLLDLIASGLKEDPTLHNIQPWVADSGEGRWTVQEAIDLDIPAPVITIALQRRLRSRQQEFYGDKLLAVIRNQFGGHAVKTKEEGS